VGENTGDAGDDGEGCVEAGAPESEDASTADDTDDKGGGDDEPKGETEDDDDSNGETEDDDDSWYEDEDEPDGDDAEASVIVKKPKLKPIDPSYTRRLPFSILAGIAGAVLGLVLIAVFSYFTKTVFFPLFLIGPLLIYYFNILFRGGRDIRTLIIVIVFSLLFDYTTELAGRAALFAFENPNYNLFSIPRMVAEAFGLPEAFSKSATDNVFPLIFTALGVFLSWEMLRAGRLKECAADGEPVDEEDDDDEVDESEDDESEEGE